MKDISLQRVLRDICMSKQEMEFSSKKITFLIFILFISTIESSSDHYCEWGMCQSWEQCCGENECCQQIDVTSYVVFAVGVLFGLIVLCWAIFLIYRYSSDTGRPIIQLVTGSYKIFSKRRGSSKTNLIVCETENYERSSDLPPSYSEIVQIR